MSEYTPTTEEIRKRASIAPAFPQFESPTLRADFDRWLAAHDAEVRAGVVAEEPEWEYRAVACEPDTGDIYDSMGVFESPTHAIEYAERYELLASNSDLPQLVLGVHRRVKAGPWVPVEN